MYWDTKRSAEIKAQIAENPDLVSKLSGIVGETLAAHGIRMADASFVFEPRVFNLRKADLPEVGQRSRKAFARAAAAETYEAEEDLPDWVYGISHCVPECGIIDPRGLEILEALRIGGIRADDPIPLGTSAGLMRAIVGNPALLNELSGKVFGILETNGIVLEPGESCVFTPFVFDAPMYAQRVATVDNIRDVRGFGPQVLLDPTPEPAVAVTFKPLPGVIDGPWGGTVGVVVHWWWWVGIPAPELLHALEVIRGM